MELLIFVKWVTWLCTVPLVDRYDAKLINGKQKWYADVNFVPPFPNR